MTNTERKQKLEQLREDYKVAPISKRLGITLQARSLKLAIEVHEKKYGKTGGQVQNTLLTNE